MFQITESNGELHVARLISSGDDPNKNQHFCIDHPEEIAVIGKNSIFDNNLSQYFGKRSLNFKGSVYANLKDEIKLKIYRLEEGCGFLLHNEKDQVVYLSRSFSLLNDYCLAQKLSLVGILVQNCPELKLQATFINNDFSRTPVTNESIDPDQYVTFDFEWNENEQQVPLGMIIDATNFHVDHSGRFFSEYSGFALNIGHFSQVIVKEEDIRYPDIFLERELNRCIVFTDFIDDNIKNILSTKIITASECQILVDNMLRTQKTNMIFTGVSSSGYGVQAHIQLLDESESTPNYQARVTKLIISPSASLPHDIPLYDR